MANLGNEKTVAGTDVWLTPPHIIEALGSFDLDPCSPVGRPWDTARHHYTIVDDGTKQPWHGRIWLNPPYGPQLATWLRLLAEHGNGIALVFARTETRAFFDGVWDRADAVLFLKGRLRFHKPDGELGGTAGSPSVLIAYGTENVQALETCGLEGKLVYLKEYADAAH
jgi:DNA N-6-adenine-methyltransferase (Dam)